MQLLFSSVARASRIGSPFGRSCMFFGGVSAFGFSISFFAGGGGGDSSELAAVSLLVFLVSGVVVQFSASFSFSLSFVRFALDPSPVAPAVALVLLSVALVFVWLVPVLGIFSPFSFSLRSCFSLSCPFCFLFLLLLFHLLFFAFAAAAPSLFSTALVLLFGPALVLFPLLLLSLLSLFPATRVGFPC